MAPAAFAYPDLTVNPGQSFRVGSVLDNVTDCTLYGYPGAWNGNVMWSGRSAGTETVYYNDYPVAPNTSGQWAFSLNCQSPIHGSLWQTAILTVNAPTPPSTQIYISQTSGYPSDTVTVSLGGSSSNTYKYQIVYAGQTCTPGPVYNGSTWTFTAAGNAWTNGQTYVVCAHACNGDVCDTTTPAPSVSYTVLTPPTPSVQLYFSSVLEKVKGLFKGARSADITTLTLN